VRVRLEPKVPCAAAREWRSNRPHERPGIVELELGPGAIEFVEFQTQ
jgi:hypothetical protein